MPPSTVTGRIATLMTIPGLKLIAPTSPHDVKGLLKAAIRDDDPVVSFEDGTAVDGCAARSPTRITSSRWAAPT